ncbi:putative thioesterase [Leptolyngbya sp. 'hensonii']|uniref:thioesterase II family protein n=1 Tax=Leptolyngbya sp. 'hensonii' TaxID=1922337 RepID=UPI00094FF2A9|nr:alpha/beta fold hydrolase [Leptolyngbya sp. 'hensonii']OLP20315.1 putative thioesterase [Leptolyngbya sp. 'hensonii']
MPEINPWMTCFKAQPQAKLRLFCFPYAGAGASVFRTWATQLPETIEVYAIQLPGRETRLREPLFTDLVPLVEALTPVLLPHFDRPFAFYGHSLGALISFSLSLQLRRSGQPLPQHLLVASRRAPQIPTQSPIHALPDPEFALALQRYDGTPEAVLQNAELMEIFLPILRADLMIHERYQHADEPPLDCPISAFGGVQDQEVSHPELAAWEFQTASSFKLRQFPGGHLFLKQEGAALLTAIVEDLSLD